MRFLTFSLAAAMAFASAGMDAEAATKKGRSSFTKEQQKKFYEQALKGCRKQFGARLHYVKVDYSGPRPRYWCYYYQ